MAESKEPSFGRLVVGKAISSTKRSFESVVRDTIVALLSIGFGFLVYSSLYGWPDAMKEVISAVAFGFAPFSFVIFIVFLWNLWLAPAELAYEAHKVALSSSGQENPIQPVNWSPWKQMPQFSIIQFAKVLAKTDPAASRETNEASAFRQLLIIAATEKMIPHMLRRRSNRFDGTSYTEGLCEESLLKREDAIAWAKTKKFDVKHIE